VSSDPCTVAVWQMGKVAGAHLLSWWFIPSFLLEWKFTSCMCHPGIAEPLAWSSFRCYFNKLNCQLKAKPSWASCNAKEQQPELPPSLSGIATRKCDKQITL